MLKKRGKAQVTLFIIIAIIIVAIGLTVFFIEKNKIFPNNSSGTMPEIKIYTQECLNQISKEGFIAMSMQGGYTNPKNFFDSNTSKISYWYYAGSKLTPSLRTIEGEISKYIDFYLPICLSNYPKKNQTEISFNESKTISTIQSNKIVFQTTFPIEVKTEDLEFTFKDLNAEIDSNFFSMYNFASDITNQLIQNNGILPLNEGLPFDLLVVPYDQKNVVYVVVDNSTLVEGQPSILVFAAKSK